MKFWVLGLLGALVTSGCVGPESDQEGVGLGPNDDGPTLERAASPREADPSPKDESGKEKKPSSAVDRTLTLSIDHAGNQCVDSEVKVTSPSGAELLNETFVLEPGTTYEKTLAIPEEGEYGGDGFFAFDHKPTEKWPTTGKCTIDVAPCLRGCASAGAGLGFDTADCPSLSDVRVNMTVDAWNDGGLLGGYGIATSSGTNCPSGEGDGDGA